MFVTGSEAGRTRRIRDPFRYIPPLPGIPPPVTLDRPWDRTPDGQFGADAMLRFRAYAAAGISAQAKLEASLGVFGNLLSATAFAGLSGSANANASTNVDTYVSLTWNDGLQQFSATLDLHAAFHLAFSLNAFAGVRVELRIPDVPVVTDLMDAVEDWPIIGWVVPDRARWRWSREYRKDWPLFAKTYDWSATQRFQIGNGMAVGSMPDAKGFAIDDVLRDLQGKQTDGEVKDDPTGPGDERRNGDTGAVSAAKSAALAQIASAKRAAEREKRANTRMLKGARAAASPPAAPGAPVPASIPGTGGTVAGLERREEKLDQALASTDQLRARTDALGEPAAAADGTTRNEARSGYDSVAANADALGDKIDRAEEGFAVPPGAEPADADYERMRTAMRQAYGAFDQAHDPTRTEKLFADDQVRESGTDPELNEYRNAALAYQGRALELWRRYRSSSRISSGRASGTSATTTHSARSCSASSSRRQSRSATTPRR